MTQIFSTKMKKMKKIIFLTTDLTDSWRAKRAKDTIITDKKRKPEKLGFAEKPRWMLHNAIALCVSAL